MTSKIENSIIQAAKSGGHQNNSHSGAAGIQSFHIKNVQNMAVTTIACHFVIDAEDHGNKMGKTAIKFLEKTGI